MLSSDRGIDKFVQGLLEKIDSVKERVALLETNAPVDLSNIIVSSDTDNALTEAATAKRLSLQLRSAAPTNADYIAFTKNHTGSETFYLVLEDA